MAWYYLSRSETWNLTDAACLEAAIAEGRDYYDDGSPFEVAEGEAYGPWDTIFNDWKDLAEHIDGRHEDNSFEEGFTEEAGLGKVELGPLCDQINAIWLAFIEREKPQSNLLNLGPAIAVPATDAYLAAQKPEDDA